MKKLIILSAIVLCFLFCVGQTAYAEGYEESNDCTFLETVSKQGHEHCYNDTDTDTDTHRDLKNNFGVKADAPNLIRLTKNSTIGVEGGKDLHDTNSDNGWFAFVKFTWSGTFFDFSKKGE